jgi:crossover junction endodeoxyribonuclease RuvC
VKILGIDPGVTGALAIYDRDRSIASGLRWVIADIPVVGDPKHELNAPALRDWLRRFSPDMAVLELVTAMPSIPGSDGKRRGMGAAGAFRFGGFFFSLKAVLACCDIPYTLVTPMVWKKFHGLIKSDKEASRTRALQLFPDQANFLSRKKDQNRAEAMLIAAYGAH